MSKNALIMVLLGLVLGCSSWQHKKKRIPANASDPHWEFVRVQPGRFIMGSPKGEKGRRGDEKQAEVTIRRPFEIGVYEVTQRQWVEVMGENPSYYRKIEYCEDNHEVVAEGSWRLLVFLGVGTKGLEMCPDNPVENVSWAEVQHFLNKLNAKEGLSGCGGRDHYGMPKGCYRLPTEAEWEYTTRGGTSSAYFFGNDGADLQKYGWYLRSQTHPVGLKKPNPFGLYDVAGNVSEWVQDRYKKKLASSRDPLNTDEEDRSRVIRGGSRYDFAKTLRSASRIRVHLRYKSNYAGFRLVRSL